MCKVLFSPLDEIKGFKKGKGLGKSFIYLLYTVVIAAFGGIILSVRVGFPFSKGLLYTVCGLLAVVVLVFVKALLYKVVVYILRGKSSFFAALTPITLSSFVLAVGLFVGLLLTFIPKLGIVLGLAVVVFSVIFAVSVKVRAMMELLDIDLITSLFVCWLVLASMFMVCYAFFALLMIYAQAGLLLSSGMMGF